MGKLAMQSDRRGGVQESDVWSASDALLLEGLRPTIERVRQKIGRGSPNTVGPYLDTWFKGLGARIRDPGAFSAPPSIPDAVGQAANHFWETALASARSEVAAAFDKERAALASEHEELAEMRQSIDADAQQLKTRIAAQEEAMQLARAQLTELREQRDRLQKEIQHHARGRSALEEKLAAVATDRDASRTQLEQERATFELNRNAIEERARSNEKRWLQEVDRAREVVREIDARLKRGEKDARNHQERLAREIARAKDDHQRSAQRIVQLSAECDGLRSAVASKDRSVAELKESAASYQKNVVGQIDTLQRQIAVALKQLGEKDREHRLLVRQLAAKRPRSSRGRQSVTT